MVTYNPHTGQGDCHYPYDNHHPYQGYVMNCPFCGGTHSLPCPTVKEVEYHPDGTIKRVVYR